MGTADFPNILDLVKSWMPRKPEPSNLSKDFWMPDESCRVCYECDSEFTMFNRRHHCRLCGRVFCAKCTSQSVPTPSEETTTLDQEDRERIRVCNYCFKQWEKGRVEIQNEEAGPVSPGGLSPTPSASSFGSTCDSAYYSTGTYEYLSPSSHSSISPQLGTAQLSPLRKSGSSGVLEQIRETATGELSHADSIKFDFQTIRSEDSNNEGSTYQSYSEARQFPQPDNYHGLVGSDEIDKDCEYCQRHTVETTESHEIGATDLEGVEYNGGESSSDIDDCEASLYDIQGSGVDNLDFENYGLLWVPPEPEVEGGDEHETSTILDDDSDGYLNGDWTYSFSSNSSNGKDFHHKEKLVEQPRSGVKNVVSGHFRSLIAQLLKAENLPVDEMNDKESWLDIVTSLSWEAAALLKPDMSGSGGMDPGGYIKVKCLACGLKSDSLLVKGVVCKKNVVHRHMMSKIDKPSILILGGALGYERISNHFSSFDTLLRQEMDHLKMAVAKIDSHHPNVLLVEKSVSRHAQGYLLGKNISLVLNIKRPLLERIARCTGAQIIPSIDHLQSPTLGFCDFFHVETYFEEHGSAGQRGKKLRKTLMFFEGCPKPLGYTILLKGANGDELKKVKHVVQYGVFAAYHLALETSFLADEGASLPELNIKSPVTVVLPDKPSGTDKAIITVRKYSPSSSGKYLENGLLHGCSNSDDGWSSVFSPMDHSSEQTKLTITSLSNLPPARQYTDCAAVPERVTGGNITPTGRDEEDMLFGPFSLSEPLKHDSCNWHPNGTSVTKHGQCTSDNIMSEEESFPENNGQKLGKETLPAPASNHQSILVSLTTRCDWKGVMCEKARLFRITYYGSFDKPLGRFLHDDLFEQDYQCRACDVPSEGHIYCYTHRQGTLTISVRKLEEFLLPGEREGKIWMWHRCLRCPRVNGFPPATMRVTMSDAAWGLSFGKFLELSFSDHAAASRVASCGHSLHRDCLRFFGCGRMVACFRYAPIAVYNVRLPPSEVQFEYLRQDWIQNDADQVNDIAELLFTEVYNVLNQIAEVVQVGSVDTGIKTCEVRKHVAELEKILKREKEEFEESLIKALNLKAKVDELIDILEINKVRRKLLFLAYAWDQRIICAVSSCKNTQKQVLGDKVIEQPADTPNTEMHDSSETDRQGLNDSDQIDAHGTFSKVSTSHKPKANDEKRNSHQEMDNTGDSEVLPELPVPNPLKSADLVQRSLSDGDTSDRTYMFDNFDKLDLIGEYKPTYIMSYKEIEQQGGARLLLKMGINGTVVPVYDDEPTSAIAYALVSPNYHDQIDDPDSYKNELESSFSLPLLNLENLLLLQSTNDLASESLRSLASADENILSTSGSRGSLLLDPLILSRALHTKVTFTDDGSLGKVKYTVTCYYAKRFEALREICCPSEIDFVRSLSRCKKWGAQGGKSNVFFAKTLDDRFIIKQVTKTELESFIKFAPAYFKYLSESISTGSPTCLAKILGIYKVSSKHLKGGKDFKMDVLVMENLLYRRNVSRVYDLKGSSRARYNPDTSGQNKVLLDQNLLETMSTSPIFVGNKAKRLLERAVWNDTAFLASIDVMDYSLLVGVDEENQELVLGIIDFMRQYTWDKHLEHWVKSSGLLGGPKNASPTVISPMQYKKRFRKAMSSYFLTVPDDWSSVPMACQTGPISEPCEQRSQT